MIRYFLLIFLCLSQLQAQDVIVSEAITNGTNIKDSEVLGRVDGQVITYVETNAKEIIRLNNEMKIDRRDTLKIGSSKLVALLLIKADLFVMVKSKLDKNYVVQLLKFNVGKQLQLKKVGNIDTIAKEDDILYEQLFVSKNKEVIGVIEYHREQNTIKTFCYDINAKLISKSNIETNDKTYILEKVICKNDSSIMALLLDERERNRESTVIYILNSKTSDIESKSIEGLKINNAIMQYDEVNENLVIAAFANKIGNNPSNKYWLFSKKKSDKEGVEKTIELEQNVWQNATADSYGKDDVGFKNYIWRDLLFKKDGGLLLVSEYYDTYNRNGYYDTRYIGTNDVFAPVYNNSTYFVYGNIFISSIGNDLNLQWNEMVRKQQITEEDKGKNSSTLIVNANTGIQLVYNEDIKPSSIVIGYNCNTNGVAKRQAILNNGKHEVFVRPRFGKQIAANAYVLPSMYKGKLNYIKVIL